MATGIAAPAKPSAKSAMTDLPSTIPGFGRQAMTSNASEEGLKEVLERLRPNDKEIDSIVAYSKATVVFFLQKDVPDPGWTREGIEGPVYLYRRRTLPRFALLIKNRLGEDLLDYCHRFWQVETLETAKNYVFYQTEKKEDRIRGLWFKDDNERMKILTALQNTLAELQGAPSVKEGLLSEAFHDLAEDDSIVALVMNTLTENKNAAGANRSSTRQDQMNIGQAVRSGRNLH
jgi:hypothetical protein